MSVTAIYEDRVMFGADIPRDINAYLQQAVAAYEDSETAESLLWQAQSLAPEQLEIYVALYKFYFYKNRLREAEAVVFAALAKSAELGGFAADWKQLSIASSSWLGNSAPQRLYLYALKALSFIRLRMADYDGAEDILMKLDELDPTDQVGGSVLRSLAAALRDTE